MMNKLIQALILLLAFSFAASPVMAKKEETKSSKAKSSKSSTAKKDKKTKKTKKEKSKKEKSNKTKTKKAEKSKSTKKEKASKSSTSSKSSKSSKNNKESDGKSSSKSKSSAKTKSSSSKSSNKKTVKSGLTGTDKAKAFKNITVNINKADAATLAHYLVGIGETRANDIVKYRKKNGKFKSTEDLMKVPGIGEGIYAGLKKNSSTSRGESSVPKK